MNVQRLKGRQDFVRVSFVQGLEEKLTECLEIKEVEGIVRSRKPGPGVGISNAHLVYHSIPCCEASGQ
jgi:hypothetical protein